MGHTSIHIFGAILEGRDKNMEEWCVAVWLGSRDWIRTTEVEW